MMKHLLLVMVVCIAIVAGVVWYLNPHATTDLFQPKAAVHVEAPSPATPVVEPARKPVIVRHVKRRRATVSRAKPAEATPNPEPFFTLPLPGDVVTGDEGSEVVGVYGAPALSIATEDSGHLMETYVYGTGRLQSVIRLEDGKVSNVSVKGFIRVARP
jgi:hypothetical protein